MEKMTEERMADEWEPIDDQGAIFTLEDWLSWRKSGGGSDWNGHGEWATATHIRTTMSYMIRDDNDRPEWATHVVWFGK